jgi:CRISPR-associated protein Csd1
MILQSLVDYYERKALDSDSNLAPGGFEQKEIPFVIVVNERGEFVHIEDTRTSEGKKKRARAFLVPQGMKKTSGVEANLLWDNAEYVLGIESVKFREKLEAESDADKQSRIKSRLSEQHAAYKARLAELSVADAGIGAVQSFLAAVPHQQLAASPFWAEIVTGNPVMTFRLVSDHELVCQRPAIVAALRVEPSETSVPNGLCLVTGEETAIERLHPSIKGVWGAQTSGANIVSFNQRSFESYGKEQRQGENAPVGKRAVFAYTTALNHLLGKDSIQRVQVGDASTVFWADKRCDLESSLPSFLREPPKDDPDRCVSAVKALYRSVSSGSLTAAEETRFFLLGLAPNAARISIRFWQEGTVAEFADRLARHFHDLEIAHAPHEKAHLPLFRLLVSIAAQGKSDNIPPNLAGDTIRSILAGLAYPATLLQAAVRRVRAEQSIPYARASLIKACINRHTRFQSYEDPDAQEELKVSLDRNNDNIGYRLGRLFAALERIQERSSGGNLNATIRDRFYGAASSTPVTVFPNLLKLSNHHLSKLDNKGEAVNLEKLKGEIVDGISDLPRVLRIEDQGSFAIGYYHQRQAFYKKADQGEQV